MPSLEGKVALITGGSRGIGFATAGALVKRGARVALVARDAAQLEQATRDLGDAALGIQADISDPVAVRRAFVQVRESFGGLHILINNAAIGRLHKVESASDADLQAAVGSNFLGVLYCVREAIPLMRSVGGGEIVNLSSEAVARPFPYLSVYAATKGAVEVLSRALRDELRPERIRVTLVRVGATASDGFTREWDPEVAAEAMAVWKAGGLLDFAAGAPMAVETVAESIVHVLTRPEGTNVDVLEVRPR